MVDAYDKFTIEYRELKSKKEKENYIKSFSDTLSFEELFELWWYESRLLYTCPILKKYSLEVLLLRAEDSPRGLIYMTVHTTRGDIRKKTVEMLLKHFKEPDRRAVEKLTGIEKITVAKFLINKGEIEDK